MVSLTHTLLCKKNIITTCVLWLIQWLTDRPAEVEYDTYAGEKLFAQVLQPYIPQSPACKESDMYSPCGIHNLMAIPATFAYLPHQPTHIP
jgi:hypothetical protein